MKNNILIAVLVILGIALVGGLYWKSKEEEKKNMQINTTNITKGDDASQDESLDDDTAGDAVDNDNTEMADTSVSSNKLYDSLSGSATLSTALAAIKGSGLDATLKGDTKYTLFVPNNDAFSKLPAATINDWLKPENKDKLTGVLNYHMVPGVYKMADLKDGQTLTAANGQTLKITKKDDKIWINDTAMVTGSEKDADNGVVYEIDTVLTPK